MGGVRGARVQDGVADLVQQVANVAQYLHTKPQHASHGLRRRNPRPTVPHDRSTGDLRQAVVALLFCNDGSSDASTVAGLTITRISDRPGGRSDLDASA